MRGETLPVQQVADIEALQGVSWLVEELWAKEAVGILGGAPKCCKSWLALEIALSVASGRPALGDHAVPRAGRVLVFAAEESPRAVRSRLEGLAARHEVDLKELPLFLIVSDNLRLDTQIDQERLLKTVAEVRPSLLVLDPLVRLHRINENAAQEVSALLSYLRDLQRHHGLAVLLVHHARKAGGGTLQAGLTLRGSSDLWAFGDSNLYLRRRRDLLELVIEHRNAPSPDPIRLRLQTQDARGPYLAKLTGPLRDPVSEDLKERVLAALHTAGEPQTQDALRSDLRVRMQRLVHILHELERVGRVRRTPAGWILAHSKDDAGSIPSLSVWKTG